MSSCSPDGDRGQRGADGRGTGWCGKEGGVSAGLLECSLIVPDLLMIRLNEPFLTICIELLGLYGRLFVFTI